MRETNARKIEVRIIENNGGRVKETADTLYSELAQQAKHRNEPHIRVFDYKKTDIKLKTFKFHELNMLKRQKCASSYLRLVSSNFGSVNESYILFQRKEHDKDEFP